MKSYTLGLDIGSNSIGWALLNDRGKAGIVDIGVRVFPEGVDRDTKGAEKSKNATRREARGARRIHRRRNFRRDILVKRLQTAGVLPKDKQQLKELLKKEPYKLRAMGLDEKLDLFNFGRVLFHLNQRRGFKSNRKTGKANENNKIAKAAGELQQKIDKAGCRTLGEYFAGLNPEENRIREQYTFRQMYEKEFDRLWKKQAEYYPEILTKELGNKIRDEIIFYQRPLKPTDNLIGDCDLEEGEKRCPRGDWYARRFRILQDVNNLKLQNPDGSEGKLTGEQRKTIIEVLEKRKELKFNDMRKKLNLMEMQEFNLEQGGKVKSLKGDVFSFAMRSKNLFGPKVWDTMDEAEKIKINEWLVDLDDDELIENMKSEYDLNDEQIDRVLKVPLPQRYMSFSRKAIRKLLPLMEEGKRTDEVLVKVYPDRNKKDIEEKDKLDLPEDLRNPIVNKALFEVRKVVNAIVREYGKPKKIKIEMARDIKGSRQEREQLQFKMRENERRNEETRKRLIEDIGIRNPSRDDVIKYNLWEECGCTCPYTGKHISQSGLFSDNPEFQIEHILPYERSLDDSYMNKTLCDVYENIHVKGNQTPFEAYNSDSEKYEQIKQRIKVLPWPKRRKFLQEKIELDECIGRELNDTRYISKEVVKYLKQLGVNVTGTRGKITAELRHQWGLNNILDLSGSDMKNRDDHRHHTIDAAVVGVTRNEHLRRLAKSKYAKTGTGLKFEPPWKDFREELAEKVKHINVSHRVSRKVSGQLHEDTAYGITGLKDKKGQDVYVSRKKLEDLTAAMIKKIVDPEVQRIVTKRLLSYGFDPAKNSGKPPKEVWNKTLYMTTIKSKKKVPIKKVRIHNVFSNMIELKDKNGKPYRAVSPGNNHHVEILEYRDLKGRTKREGKVVSLFEAVSRLRKRRPVVKKEHGADKKFICSLCKGDMFMFEKNSEEAILCRIQEIWESTNIVLRPHTNATESVDINKTASKLRGHKVTVDPLGRVRRAND